MDTSPSPLPTFFSGAAAAEAPTANASATIPMRTMQALPSGKMAAQSTLSRHASYAALHAGRLAAPAASPVADFPRQRGRAEAAPGVEGQPGLLRALQPVPHPAEHLVLRRGLGGDGPQRHA